MPLPSKSSGNKSIPGKNKTGGETIKEYYLKAVITAPLEKEFNIVKSISEHYQGFERNYINTIGTAIKIIKVGKIPIIKVCYMLWFINPKQRWIPHHPNYFKETYIGIILKNTDIKNKKYLHRINEIKSEIKKYSHNPYSSVNIVNYETPINIPEIKDSILTILKKRTQRIGRTNKFIDLIKKYFLKIQPE